MKKILVATDFSADSQYTLDYILDFVQATSALCQIVLLNTYIVQQTDASQVISLNDELKSKSKKQLNSAVEDALSKINTPLVTIEAISHMGSLKNVIHQLFQKDKYDLVAMGKDGGKHVEAVATLLKTEKCPLLITYKH